MCKSEDQITWTGIKVRGTDSHQAISRRLKIKPRRSDDPLQANKRRETRFWTAGGLQQSQKDLTLDKNKGQQKLSVKAHLRFFTSLIRLRSLKTGQSDAFYHQRDAFLSFKAALESCWCLERLLSKLTGAGAERQIKKLAELAGLEIPVSMLERRRSNLADVSSVLEGRWWETEINLHWLQLSNKLLWLNKRLKKGRLKRCKQRSRYTWQTEVPS